MRHWTVAAIPSAPSPLPLVVPRRLLLSTAPLRNGLVTLVNLVHRATSNRRALLDLRTSATISLIDVNATVNIFLRAERRQSLGGHVAEAVVAHEIRSPGHRVLAEALGRLSGAVGDDKVLLHGGWALTEVDGCAGAVAGAALGRVV